MLGFGDPTFTIDNIPDQTGRVIFVTGGNAGLGKVTIAALARSNAKLYMASRTESKARAAIEDIKARVPTADITFIPLDLTSFASIGACANTFLSKETRLHVLINNAGVMALPYSETAEGYEIQFGTNYIGHFLLTKLLLPALERTAEESPAGSVRIVNLASIGHNLAYRGIQLEALSQQLKSATTYERYGVSKLASILHAKELARRYPKIVSVSAHPGVIMSGLYSTLVSGNFLYKAGFETMKLVGSTPEVGALNQLFCAAGDVKAEDNGEYFVPVGRKGVDAWWHEKPSKYAKDGELARKLWEWSEEKMKEH